MQEDRRKKTSVLGVEVVIALSMLAALGCLFDTTERLRQTAGEKGRAYTTAQAEVKAKGEYRNYNRRQRVQGGVSLYYSDPLLFLEHGLG